MNQLVGFKSINSTNDINSLKRELLIFDKIFIVGLQEMKDIIESNSINNTNDLLSQKGLISLNDFIIYQGYIIAKEQVNKAGGLDSYYSAHRTDEKEYWHQNLEYLLDKGKLIYDYNLVNKDTAYYDAHNTINPIIKKILSAEEQKSSKHLYKLVLLAHDLKTRILSSSSTLLNCTSIPCSSSFYEVKNITTLKAQVYNLILEDFPIVHADELSWEQIFDFKSDPDVYNSIWGLRSWISEVSRTDMTINEIEEQYRELKFKYEQAIKIHKLKISNSSFQTTIQTGAELLENIARLKFSKMADLLFKFKEDKISLLENELKSDGNQLSYLFKIKDKLSI